MPTPDYDGLAARMGGQAVRGLLEPGNIDVSQLPAVPNPDGSVSTVRSISFNDSGREILVPTVVDGHVVSNQVAIDAYRRSGRHLGKFDTVANATAFAQNLHNQEAARVATGRQTPDYDALAQQAQTGTPAGGGDALVQNLKNVAMFPIRMAQQAGHLIAAHPAAAGAMALSVPMGLATVGLSIPAAMGAVGLAGAGGAGAGLAASQVATRDTAPAPTVAGNVQTMAEQGALAAGGEGLARGASAAVQAVPRVARAAGNFQTVMNAAKDVPVDIEAPGKAALATMQLAERGGTMPTAVNKFIRYVTDPNRGDFTYAEARDFASNISRLSVNDYQKLTPVMARSVADLRVALNQSVADAAQQAGKGAEYRVAMTEYAQAMRVRDAMNTAVEAAKRALPAAGVGSGAYWLTSQLRRLLSP